MIKLLLLIILSSASAQAQESIIQKTPRPAPVYDLSLLQEDRNRIDELIIELRMLNTKIESIKKSEKVVSRKVRKRRVK